jgi:hypothetical protein
MLLDDNERIFFCQKMKKQLSHCPRFDKKSLKTLFSNFFLKKKKNWFRWSQKVEDMFQDYTDSNIAISSTNFPLEYNKTLFAI